MAWSVTKNSIQMAEGDFGIELPLTFSGFTPGPNDSIKFVFKAAKNGEEILVKEISNIKQRKVALKFTESDSAKFPVGTYVYSMDWYRNGVFRCNIILSATFKVVDKA